MVKVRVGAVSIALLLLSACNAREPRTPEVLGLRFGAPTDSFRQFLPDSAVRESYPLIPAFGYELNFPNPDGWNMIVQDSSEDMLRNQVYGIYISRMGSDNCTQKSVDSLMRAIRTRQLVGFDQTVMKPDANGLGVRAIGLGARRMLTVGVSCFIRTLSANFSYLDRDAFAYRDTLQADSLLRQVSNAIKGYESRKLN